MVVGGVLACSLGQTVVGDVGFRSYRLDFLAVPVPLFGCLVRRRNAVGLDFLLARLSSDCLHAHLLWG